MYSTWSLKVLSLLSLRLKSLKLITVLSRRKFGIQVDKKDTGLSLAHITSRSSFENVQSWLKDIRYHTDPNVVIMLVGNKVDLSKSSREVETEEGRSLAEDEGFLFIETSALDATNIDTAFTTLISKLCSNLPEKPQATPSQSITKKRMQSRFPRIRGLFSRKEITEKEKEIFLDLSR
ncbi:hypothetical protein G6F29_012210 [Rhizopus arrhizus]|nr:hypothetical protein G6F19_012339 [Rhizopus arrhizus]KAG0929066.1 hypothetical protein G6F30_012151 [Rhizopus arrhizus]KAG0974444.1 hypothetical protein G6F29_012210 [Rhizopus arrhizus]KAG1278602.1 hypothetical protein G6F66_012045 [Rhizopus arrhizus]KAG1392002.1 hypothetical protein G6F60_012278 [Rhizopus arrhizus]